jgi:hypothetical protein
MGIRLFGGSASRSAEAMNGDTTSLLPGDPDPTTFEVVDLEQVGRFVIGKVRYPNATNFEGRKILVWDNATVDEIENMKAIDPHFTHQNKIIARFRPTERGLELARRFCYFVYND